MEQLPLPLKFKPKHPKSLWPCWLGESVEHDYQYRYAQMEMELEAHRRYEQIRQAQEEAIRRHHQSMLRDIQLEQQRRSMYAEPTNRWQPDESNMQQVPRQRQSSWFRRIFGG